MCDSEARPPRSADKAGVVDIQAHFLFIYLQAIKEWKHLTCRSGFHFSTQVIHSFTLWILKIIYGLMLPVQQLRCIVFLFIFCSYDRLWRYVYGTQWSSAWCSIPIISPLFSLIGYVFIPSLQTGCLLLDTSSWDQPVYLHPGFQSIASDLLELTCKVLCVG